MEKCSLSGAHDRDVIMPLGNSAEKVGIWLANIDIISMTRVTAYTVGLNQKQLHG